MSLTVSVLRGDALCVVFVLGARDCGRGVCVDADGLVAVMRERVGDFGGVSDLVAAAVPREGMGNDEEQVALRGYGWSAPSRTFPGASVAPGNRTGVRLKARVVGKSTL